MSESPQRTLREVTSQLNDLALASGPQMDSKVKQAMRKQFLTLLRQADELIKRGYATDHERLTAACAKPAKCTDRLRRPCGYGIGCRKKATRSVSGGWMCGECYERYTAICQDMKRRLAQNRAVHAEPEGDDLEEDTLVEPGKESDPEADLEKLLELASKMQRLIARRSQEKPPLNPLGQPFKS